MKKSTFPKKNVDFCVNVDIGSWDEQMKEFSDKIPPSFMCMSKYDILKFARVNVLGVNTPQIYLKVRGNWTGGHQENLSLRAININFGPSSTIWHAIALPKDIEEFRRLVLEKYKLDIKKHEGLWFCDIDFCLANKTPVITFNQRKGDLVLLGPTVLHWVRTLGLTTQSAWNFGSCDLYQLEQMNIRYTYNKEYNFVNIIPFLTTLTDLMLSDLAKKNHSVLKFIHKILTKQIKKTRLKIENFRETLRKELKYS